MGWVHENFYSLYMNEVQRLNHFRNHYELTRKDLLVKNIKRQIRQSEKNAVGLPPTAAQTMVREFQIVPKSFVLPLEYNLFLEEYKRKQSDPDANVWIMKPVGRAQGKGIFLVTHPKQIDANLKTTKNAAIQAGERVENFVVQTYMRDPYLVGGRKFDLRIYTLVTSFRPLRAYLYRDGFARFTGSRFSMNKSDLQNLALHLTNTAVQKKAEDYDRDRGSKWSLHALKMHLIANHGSELANTCFGNIQALILKALHSVSNIIIQDKHCFELYGYDVMIDSQLRPWLIEVNASPSLSPDTGADYRLKFGMLSDMLDVLDIEGLRPDDTPPVQCGGFDLIYDGGNPIAARRPTSMPTALGCANDSPHLALAATYSKRFTNQPGDRSILPHMIVPTAA